MFKPLFWGALLGGIVVFAWSFVSWTILPWHKSDMKAFTSEPEVAGVLARNMTGDGIYYLPAVPPSYQTMSASQKKAADAQMEADMKRGPIVYGLVRGGMVVSMPRLMGAGLLFDVLSALLVSMLVMKTGGMTYGGRVSFILTAALAVGLIAFVPNWIWFGYPTRWVLVMIADTLIAWLLAGLVIAKVAAPKPAGAMA